MELPKNITQIGEADRRCKVYVEDYVVSYIRQINHLAENKTIGIALYGIRKEEGEVGYFFFYGACKLDMLQREVRHLSQAQMQEIERLRKKFFPDYQFLGYRLLNGEMVEGFHVCEQGICRYIAGYACFYEKNDLMLAYMLDSRGEEPEPEQVDEEKFEKVRRRQETRKQEYQEQAKQGNRTAEEKKSSESKKEEDGREQHFFRNRDLRKSRAERTANIRLEKEDPMGGSLETEEKKASSGTMRMMRLSVVGMFLLLCVVGLVALFDNGGIEGIQVAAKRMWEGVMQKKVPDSEEMLPAMNPSGTGSVLFAEDNLTDAIQKENSVQEWQPSAETASPEASVPQAVTDIPGESQAETESLPQNSESGDPGSNTEPGQPESGDSGTDAESGQPDSGDFGTDTAPTQTEMIGDVKETEPSEEPGQPQPEEARPASSQITYIIQKGDTLTGISMSHYGTDKRVIDICELNGISNPDDIYYGQKIILP